MTPSAFVVASLALALCGFPQTPPNSATPIPAHLPGKGLAQHDFMYTGESHDRRIFIVRHGEIVWTYDDPAGKGEISDAVMLSNGNILFAHQFGVSIITQDKKIIWNFDAPAGKEIHTAVPIGTDHVLFVINGDLPVVRVVNIVTGVTDREFTLPAKHPIGVHGQFRHVRLTSNGTLVVAFMQMNKVVEYDFDGNELWSFPADSPWGVTPLLNGNLLITDRTGVREITRRGDTAWTFAQSDALDYKFTTFQQAWRLQNGNTVVTNWVNEWNTKPEERTGTLQALELTPSKEVVWALASWTPPSNLGPLSTLQFLDEPSAPENMHFGPIH
jgi:outer membrane protein assembly factor BamB